MKKNWLQTTANEIVIMVLIHLPNSKNLSNLIKSEFCPLFKLSLLVFLVSKIENLCCSVELPCVSYHWELSSIKISKISFFEFLDIFHQNQPECLKYSPDMTLQLPWLFAHLTAKRVRWIFIKKCWTKQNFEVRCLVTALFLAKEVAKYRKSTLWHA